MSLQNPLKPLLNYFLHFTDEEAASVRTAFEAELRAALHIGVLAWAALLQGALAEQSRLRPLEHVLLCLDHRHSSPYQNFSWEVLEDPPPVGQM